MTPSAPFSLAKTRILEGVMELLLNRPEKKNALTQDMYRFLAKSLKAADQDDAVRVVLLRGAGDCFCSGNDVTDFPGSREPGEKSPGILFMEVLNRLEKPLIAAVQGAAVGIGTTMLLHCDLVYASTNATFQVPFVNLGLCPEGGSSYLLPRLVGHFRASEMLLLGEPITSMTAKQFGLVNEVYEQADLTEVAWRNARKLAKLPIQSVLLTKRMIKQSRLSIVSETILFEGRHFAERLKSEDFKEAADAFLSRRKTIDG